MTARPQPAVREQTPPPVTPEFVRPRGSDYAALMRRVRQAGLLERRLPYYAWKTAATAAVFAAAWAALWAIGDSWWMLGPAVVLAAVFAQLAFLGHDAGHKQIFRTRRANHWYGLVVGNLATGVSIGWWTSNHNRHHAHPNTEGDDPDVSGILAHSGARAATEKGWRRFIFRYQAWLFFPLLLLEAGSLHFSSVRAVLTWPIPHRVREGAFLAAHAVGYLAGVFLLLEPVKALVFIAVQQSLFGFYMGCTFAPNHKGMEVFPEGDNTDFLRRQVLSSRNVRGSMLTDLALGGLNYQVEHHLFPSMPRPALRAAQPMVRTFCAELGVPYAETSLLTSYSEALRHLNAVGRQAAI
ncbi:fatty acid desaturase family protein [Nocardia tengchongensis]|uniref:fatty acid desaturase family protein n=1 Tax=Nocardia tengchongensis TaxID=2055889 RepID=UPI0036A6B50F